MDFPIVSSTAAGRPTKSHCTILPSCSEHLGVGMPGKGCTLHWSCLTKVGKLFAFFAKYSQAASFSDCQQRHVLTPAPSDATNRRSIPESQVVVEEDRPK